MMVGGFGTVYRAALPDMVAISSKVIVNSYPKWKQLERWNILTLFLYLASVFVVMNGSWYMSNGEWESWDVA